MIKPEGDGGATGIKNTHSGEPLHERNRMKRYGMLIKVKEDSIAMYKEYHAKVWPEVLATIRACNIKNYSIFLKDDFLFAYFEYHGTDYDDDMKKMAADPKTQDWWKIMMPIQVPIESRSEGEWWAQMEEVFHAE
jgi:L-rhamnose mutarotase